MQNAPHAVEAFTIGVSNKITVAGGATAVATSAAQKVGVLTMTTPAGTLDVAGFCALCGLLLAVCGYFTSLYFQLRRDRREDREHLAKLKPVPLPVKNEK